MPAAVARPVGNALGPLSIASDVHVVGSSSRYARTPVAGTSDTGGTDVDIVAGQLGVARNCVYRERVTVSMLMCCVNSQVK
jgi:hypothetical protein